MKCNKCNSKSRPFDLSYNNEYGWICESCAKETNTVLNLFLNKKILKETIKK